MSMVQIKTGDLLHSGADALVNTVNTVGIMGKGIALQFKEAFPLNYKIYVEACKNGELQPGKILAVWEDNLLLGKKLILNFPTKEHWKSKSKYSFIQSGIKALREVLIEKKVKSIAIPPLGCGNGGLEWEKVKPIIITGLADLDMEIFIFEPNSRIKTVLQNQNVHKSAGLTPARAALLYLLFAFESMGEYSSLFAANKIAYFLQRNGMDLRLNFQRHIYGPYAIGVEKVLYALNGVYLHGMEQGSVKPFESLRLNYEKWMEIKKYVAEELTPEDDRRLENLLQFIGGFTSELSLEILATVDYILFEKKDASVEEVMTEIKSWNPRKERLFSREYVELAYNHILRHQNSSLAIV